MTYSSVLVLRCLEHELLLFASFWFVVGAADEIAVDIVWLWLRATGRGRTSRLPHGYEQRPLNGHLAVMVPAWQEAEVIGEMIGHTLRAWPQRGLTLYVGCYRNDPATVASAMATAGGDPRLRLIIHNRHGPTTKADCLNRLYRAMADDERRRGVAYTGVVLHDSEDMVHPCALAAIDRALQDVDFVQLPVRPEPQRASPWIAGHYTDEFTEAHAKTLVVRDALGAGIPAAGVGCGFARHTLARLAGQRAATAPADTGADASGPFAAECLTEDYELGLLISRAGRGDGGAARVRFLRTRDGAGQLVATRAFFPATLDESVRQKTRWIHGIALQGWDRLGWTRRPADLWMTLRDRRGPLVAVVLSCAYLLLVVEALLLGLEAAGLHARLRTSPLLSVLVTLSFASFVWRCLWRFAFTAHEYGLWEGLRAMLRIPVANVIAILAGRRALFAYLRTLRGAAVHWDKTRHVHHPATATATAHVLAR